jgi:mannose-6-phosphate isomerase-like protein (cupin superfamily)
MYTRNKSDAPQGNLDGLVSYFMLRGKDVPSANLTVTWVEVQPEAKQPFHQHLPEQVYVIIQGKGRMRVGDDYRDLTVGDIAYVPPNTTHGLENTGDGVLMYVSAATPVLDVDKAYGPDGDYV